MTKLFEVSLLIFSSRTEILSSKEFISVSVFLDAIFKRTVSNDSFGDAEYFAIFWPSNYTSIILSILGNVSFSHCDLYLSKTSCSLFIIRE